MSIYEYLSSHPSKRKRNTPEKKFRMMYSSFLDSAPKFKELLGSKNELSLIQENILIRFVQNVNRLIETLDQLQTRFSENQLSNEQVIEELKPVFTEMPYMVHEAHRYYFPFFDSTLNYLIRFEPLRLFTYPYNEYIRHYQKSIIDGFELYNYELYNSYFTKLILLCEDETAAAFYHIDERVIYVINRQGRLDHKICLFDRYMLHGSHSDILTRAKRAMQFYFANDRERFVRSLYQEKLISYYAYRHLRRTV